VINSAIARQCTDVSLAASTVDDRETGAPTEAGPAPKALDDRQMRELVHAHFDFIWRLLRRLGVPEAGVDDAAQLVFLVASRKMVDAPFAKQKSFLFGVALRVASDERRARKRQPPLATDEVSDVADLAPGPEDLLDHQRRRRAVDRILEGLPLEMRVVFVLFEVEEMTMSEIAELLDLPSGTVASRLRRARQLFEQGVTRFRAARHAGGVR